MSKDRYERRHRRTAKNAACVETMAGADFGAVPSLAEAMGLEGSKPAPAPTHTHTHTGHPHGSMYGYTRRPEIHGRTHALNGVPHAYEGAVYAALCGVTVRCQTEVGEGALPNVRAAGSAEARQVTCKRCLQAAGRA